MIMYSSIDEFKVWLESFIEIEKVYRLREQINEYMVEYEVDFVDACRELVIYEYLDSELYGDYFESRFETEMINLLSGKGIQWHYRFLTMVSEIETFEDKHTLSEVIDLLKHFDEDQRGQEYIDRDKQTYLYTFIWADNWNGDINQLRDWLIGLNELNDIYSLREKIHLVMIEEEMNYHDAFELIHEEYIEWDPELLEEYGYESFGKSYAERLLAGEDILNDPKIQEIIRSVNDDEVSQRLLKEVIGLLTLLGMKMN